MQRILAIAWLTWKAALRFKLFLVIAALLILGGRRPAAGHQGRRHGAGFTQIILTYTLSAITALLGLSTLWLACGTLARDIEECQIQVVATKPVARWQIWLGKWLGIVSLNAALLAISGGVRLRLVAMARHAICRRRSRKSCASRSWWPAARPRRPAMRPKLKRTPTQILQETLKASAGDSAADLPELRKQIREHGQGGFASGAAELYARLEN